MVVDAFTVSSYTYTFTGQGGYKEEMATLKASGKRARDDDDDEDEELGEEDEEDEDGRAGVRGGAVGAPACNLIPFQVLLVGRVPLDRAQ